MLTEFHVKNFKSIHDLRLEPGRVTVLIGENGSGKSNILEGLAFAGAAIAGKLDHEFLGSRGLRTTDPRFMRSAFESDREEPIQIHVTVDAQASSLTLLHHGTGPYAKWTELDVETTPQSDPPTAVREYFGIETRVEPPLLNRRFYGDMVRLARAQHSASLIDFLIYSPENTALRNFEQEGQILPLGVKGEGLFQLLKTLAADEPRMAEIRENLRLIDWFEDIRLATDLAPFERRLGIRDRYLASGDANLAYFDQRSSNEGFLFLLFYFALLVSPATPKLFAIDNIDASLNPKLCTELMRRMVALAVKHDKQMLITTHNPAVLDGLDLHDDQQRLYAVYRNTRGHTKARRILPPKPLGDEPPIKLSEAFLRGLLGGLPQNF